ncbi:hypothetical protein HDU67_009574 [Dinochytrium kinnereticum]|nr:hypothetical protein HDU67_009574 [Dinochytrium kinnereticum]
MASLTDLNQIYEQSRRLTAHIVTPGNIPQLERGLDQIAAQTRKLSTKSARAGDGSAFRASAGEGGPVSTGQIDSRTAYLLANRGFDADKVSATLSMIDPAATFEPVEGLYDTDIEGYLKLEHEHIIMTAIDESRAQTLKDCDERFERTLHRDWEKAKKRIFEELGQHQQKLTQKGLRSPGRPLLGRQGGPTPSSVGGLVGGQSQQGSSVSMQMLTRNKNYSQVVDTLNKSRLEKKPFEPIQAFFNVAQKLDRGDVGHQSLMKCWKLLYFTFIDQGLKHGPGGTNRKKHIRELEFAKAYKAQEEGNGMSEDAVQFRKMVIAGGKEFLHENHWEFIQQVVTNNKVQVGGLPDPNVVIDAYIDLKYQRYGSWQPQHGLEIVEGRAVWAHIYYLLRSGLKMEALQYARSVSARLEGSPDSRFFLYFREFLEDGRLSSAHRNEVIDAWNSRIRNGLSVDASGRPRCDPFKATLYKIIGRCEMTTKTIKNVDVMPSVEDYIWLQLMLIQEDYRSDDLLQDRFTLRDMARTILRFGAAHFSPQNQTPHVYFLVLLLCGEYERAIAHIISHEVFTVEAIHFAIAVAYYGALRVPDSPHMIDIGYELLSIRAAEMTSLGSIEIAYFQFERMLHQYARQFFQTDPVDALHYLTLISIFGRDYPSGSASAMNRSEGGASGRAYIEATQAHVRELLLDSGIPEKLIGESKSNADSDGVIRVRGEIEKLGPLFGVETHSELLQYIVRPAAEEADRQGRLTEAVRLFNYSEEYDTVVGILCKQLGDSLATHRLPTELSDPLMAAVAGGSTTSGLSFSASGIGGMGVGSAGFAPTEVIPAKAMEVLQHYRSSPLIQSRISNERRQTCSILMQLHQFARELDGGRYDTALETLASSGIVPSEPDMASISRLTDGFRSLDESIARCLPQVLLLAMMTVVSLYRGLKDGRFGNGVKQTRMGELQNQARAILLFSSSIQYRIPADTLQRLNRLDALVR